MRRLVLALALMGLVASPALADLTPSLYTPTPADLGPTNGHTVGIYDGAGGIYTNITQAADASDVFTVEFAFHWPYSTAVNMIQFWSSIVWDSDEIQITGISPYGNAPGWGDANYAGSTAFFSGIVNSGTVTVGDVLGAGVPLWQNPSGGVSGSTTIVGSQVVPFMQVQFQVLNPVDDGYLDLLIGSAAVLFSSGGQLYTTLGHVADETYGIAIVPVPEPASISLLAGGILAIGAGIWRRRR